jgi:hypothetical protein
MLLLIHAWISNGKKGTIFVDRIDNINDVLKDCIRYSILGVLKSAEVDTEVIRYLHAKQVIAMFTQAWRSYDAKDTKQRPPWEHIEIELELVVHYLYVSYLK